MQSKIVSCMCVTIAFSFAPQRQLIMGIGTPRGSQRSDNVTQLVFEANTSPWPIKNPRR